MFKHLKTNVRIPVCKIVVTQICSADDYSVVEHIQFHVLYSDQFIVPFGQ